MAKSRRARRVSAASQQTAQKKKTQSLLMAAGGVAVVVVIALVVVFASGGGSAEASDFSFTLYQGTQELGSKDMELSRLEGRPVVLNFWAGLCPPCRAEMPQFQQFYDEFKDDVTLVGIDIGPFMRLGSHQDAEDLLRELGVTYPAGFTNDGSVPRKYGVTAMPTTVFIKPNGEIFDKRSGAIDRNILARITTDMMADQGQQ